MVIAFIVGVIVLGISLGLWLQKKMKDKHQL
jgi:hypothetical protein